MIFLDNFTATRPSSKVLEKYIALIQNEWMPHFAPYQTSPTLAIQLDRAIETLYELIGADEGDFFVSLSGEEEAFSFVLQNVFLERLSQTGKNFILVPGTEGASILKGAKTLENIGTETLLLPVDTNGRLTRELLEKHTTPKAGLLALSWVHPLTGVIQPIWEIAQYCKDKDILLFVQGSEIFAKVFFQFRDLPIDFFAFTGEKCHGPKNTGGLFIKGSVPCKRAYKKGKIPLVEIKDVAGLIALGVAANEMIESRDGLCMEMARLRELFESELEEAFPGVVFFGKGGPRVPTTSVFAIPFVSAELLLFRLKERGIFLSKGGGRVQKLERILEICGFDPFLAKCALSATFSMQTSEEDVKRALQEIILIGKELLTYTQDFARG